MLLANDPKLIERPQAAEEILKAGKQARDLITQILAFSRKMDPVLTPVDLNQVVGETKRMLARTIPKMTDITYSLSPEKTMINADAGNMTQVLMNLCANAQDAMPDGGRIEIKTAGVTLDENFSARHTGIEPGDFVLLSVTDTGTGMDQDTMEHIFDPFFTSKEIGKGTGLGLSTVYGIVKSHGGHIICDSEPGKGTTFRIYLPAMAAVTPAEDQFEMPMLEDAQGNGEVILIVDDERLIRDIGEKILTFKGYRVIEAVSGEDALQIYRERGKEIDLVILDISMPGMGGEKCLDELFVLDPMIKVILASGYFSDGMSRTATDKILAYLQKPFTINTMVRTIREVLDR